jgi:hypothetical protein
MGPGTTTLGRFRLAATPIERASSIALQVGKVGSQIAVAVSASRRTMSIVAATKHNIFETIFGVLGSGSVGRPDPKAGQALRRYAILLHRSVQGLPPAVSAPNKAR